MPELIMSKERHLLLAQLKEKGCCEILFGWGGYWFSPAFEAPLVRGFGFFLVLRNLIL